MNWFIATGKEVGKESHIRCGACRLAIPVGQRYAELTDARLKRCVPCLRATGHRYVAVAQSNVDRASTEEARRAAQIALEEAKAEAAAYLADLEGVA